MEKRWPYRIKTKTEFEKEFGSNWREYVVLGWVDEMNHFFGQPVEVDHILDEYKERGYDKSLLKLYHNGYYNISWDMLTENKPKEPSYKPRKIIREL